MKSLGDSCAAGFFKKNGECEPCDVDCATCKDETGECTSCVNNMVLSNGICSCQSKYQYEEFSTCKSCPKRNQWWNPASGDCESCTDRCSVCNMQGTCDKCEYGFVLKDGQCGCRDGFVLNDKGTACEACPKGTYVLNGKC